MTMKRASIIILTIIPLMLLSQGLDNYINVHFYPHTLSPQDILRDGPYGKKFYIQEETFLIWVDLYPELFFVHDTAYIFITKDNVQVESGSLWPDLNRKMVLHNEHGKYAVISPFELPSNSSGGYINDKIAIHVYPHELTSRDKLTDGPEGESFKIYNNTQLIWIDFLPGAFFAHPTAYILISKEDIRVLDGNWWPELNGRVILYGQENKTGILSPFRIAY